MDRSNMAAPTAFRPAAGMAIDPNGSSVLDALGLPRGTIALNQSVELTNQTTLRAATRSRSDSRHRARTATITIDQGETFDSLVVKINSQLGAIGKASVNYTGGGENLKIQVNAGKTINLIAGPKTLTRWAARASPPAC
jgi:hypothetical protein